MPSGTQKEEKPGWKSRSRQNKGTRKVNGFFTTASMCGGFKEQGYLSEFGKVWKALVLSNRTRKKITSAINLHKHTFLAWNTKDGFLIRMQPKHLNPHANPQLLTRYKNAGSYNKCIFIIDTLMYSLSCIQHLELIHLGYARMKQIHSKLPMQSPNFCTKP